MQKSKMTEYERLGMSRSSYYRMLERNRVERMERKFDEMVEERDQALAKLEKCRTLLEEEIDKYNRLQHCYRKLVDGRRSGGGGGGGSSSRVIRESGRQ